MGVFRRIPLGSVELLPGMCQISGCLACPKILFLHFGVSTGARDLIPREQQSGAVSKSTVIVTRPFCSSFVLTDGQWTTSKME
jgi:hypothetical protein